MTEDQELRENQTIIAHKHIARTSASPLNLIRLHGVTMVPLVRVREVLINAMMGEIGFSLNQRCYLLAKITVELEKGGS